jgi:hypothetical protein
MTQSPSRICSSIIDSPRTRSTYVSRLPATSESGTLMVSLPVTASIGMPAAT